MIKRLLSAIRKPDHYKDEYVELLRKVNAGMLHHGNIKCFNHAIENLPSDNPIVEIGTFCGLSANIITYFKKKYCRKNLLLTVDNWYLPDKPVPIAKSTITYLDYYKYVRENLIRNLTLFSNFDLPYAFENGSGLFFENWKAETTCQDIFKKTVRLGGSISFVYIDGNHSFQNVLNDFENSDKYLDVGGYILFDDSADFSGWEVTRVIKIVKKTGRYSVVMKNPNYLFKKII